MPWQQRASKLFFYESVRGADGRPRKIYRGRGARAQSAAEQVADAQAQRLRDRQSLEALTAALEPADQSTAYAEAGIAMLMEAVLRASGHGRRAN